MTLATDAALVKHQRPRGFVMLDNAAVNDDRLTFRARGLLAYLLGRPDGWAFASRRIAKLSPSEGRDAILTALSELEAAGYVRRTQLRVHGGRFRTVTEVAELPELMPAPETASPGPAEPDPVGPDPARPDAVVRTEAVRTEVVRKDVDRDVTSPADAEAAAACARAREAWGEQ